MAIKYVDMTTQEKIGLKDRRDLLVEKGSFEVR